MVSKRRPFLTAFCIPVAVMIAIIIYKGIYPFGDRCFLRVDLYNQYLPFFTEFHRKIREGETLLFSWRAGLGANFPALYAYYLASPFNWLLFLCPQEYLIEWMTGMIVVKIGLCGLSFAWYLKRHFGTDGYDITLFSLFYALSGFMAAYNWNIMWLDCIIIAPVIIFGLEELIWRGRPFLYCISLGFSILSNYYISMLICIFLVFYCVVLMLAPPRTAALSFWQQCRRLGQFILYSMLAAGLAAAVLLPGALAIRATRFDQMRFPSRTEIYFLPWEILARHCMNVSTEIRNAHWPNIYCGAAVFLLIPLYLFCRQIRWREKLLRLALVVMFYLSFSVNVADFLWHGMNFPDNLPARQSFLYLFLILVMGYEAYYQYRRAGIFCHRICLRQALSPAGQKLRNSVLWLLLLSAFAGLGILGLCLIYRDWGNVSSQNVLFTVLYLLLYTILLLALAIAGFYGERSKNIRNMAVALLFCVAVTEAAGNMMTTSVMTTSRSQYQAYVDSREKLLAALGETERFYRVEEIGRMTKNDGMLGDYPTATFFSSTVNASMAHFYKRMGMSSSKVFYCFDGATPLAAALLGVRYLLSDSPALSQDLHTLLFQEGECCLYQNHDTLPPGFVVDPELEQRWEMEEGDPARVQNSLAEALGVDQPLFYDVPVIYEQGEAVVEAASDGHYYVYPESCATRDITVSAGGEESVYEKVYYPRMLDLGWLQAGEKVRLSQSGETRNERKRLRVSAVRLSAPALQETLRCLGQSPMEITEVTGNSLSGQVDARQAGLLVTAIPGEDGWRAVVDGRPVPVRLFGGALLGVEVPEGVHQVTFTYTPPGAVAGLLLSAATAAILMVLCLSDLNSRRRRS